jgi:hypothetical protein
MDRKAAIRAAVAGYFAGLAAKDFELIPFASTVSLRAPLAPGGSHQPIVGREAVRDIWWSPLPPLLGDVVCSGVYFDDALTGAVGTGEVEVLTDPPVRLRVADRFTVDEQGLIVEQENHFDPRDVTNPGWRAVDSSA